MDERRRATLLGRRCHSARYQALDYHQQDSTTNQLPPPTNNHQSPAEETPSGGLVG